MTALDTSALQSLLARLEAAAGPNIHLDVELWVQLGSAELRDTQWSDRKPVDPGARCNGLEMGEAIAARWPAADIRTTWKVPALTASLDAAVALVERVLPDFEWIVRRDRDRGAFANIYPDGSNFDCPHFPAYAPTPALAICIALVRALITRGETL